MKITRSQLAKMIKEVYDEHIENYPESHSTDETPASAQFFDVQDVDTYDEEIGDWRYELEDVTQSDFFRWLDDNPEYSETVPPENADKSNNVIWVTTAHDPHEQQLSQDAIAANKPEGKLSFEDWVEENGGPEAFGPDDNAYDIWLRYAQPEKYETANDWYEQRHIDDQDMWHPEDKKQELIDKHMGSDSEGGVLTDEEDELLGTYRESKEFTFDKFMKDINGREEKIAQYKKELTENEGDTNARLRQKLYQEDWRNSVKFKGNK